MMDPATDGQHKIASQPELPPGDFNEDNNDSKHIEPAAMKTEIPRVLQLTHQLEDCDWEQLQERYADAMEEHGREEENLRVETARLLEVFMTWSQTTVLQDENRALKRFKTQMQHVQNSELQVENKKRHYMEVVKAFQIALALLNDQLKA